MSLIFIATEKGLILWYKRILPSLLPFAILSNIIISSNILDKIFIKLSKNRYFSYLLYSFICILGNFLGLPIGCKIVCDLYKQKLLSKQYAQMLLPILGSFSYSFICNYCIGCISNDTNNTMCSYLCIYIPIILFFIFMVFRLSKNNQISNTQKETASRFHLDMQIIDAGILNGFETLIKLCGYIVLFSIISEYTLRISSISALYKTLFLCMIEVTNGMQNLSMLKINSSIKSMIGLSSISFGGFCCYFQLKSMINETDLSARKYLFHKLLLTGITLIMAFILFILPNLLNRL